MLLLLHQPGDVLSNLYHLHHLAFAVEDRIVAGLQPYPFAAPVEALKTPGNELAARQALPMPPIIVGSGELRRAQHRMRLPARLFQPIAHQRQHIVVSADNGALRRESDHRHRAIQRRQQAAVFLRLGHSLGHFAGDLDDFHHLTLFIQHRCIGALQPYRLAVFAMRFMVSVMGWPLFSVSQCLRYNGLAT